MDRDEENPGVANDEHPDGEQERGVECGPESELERQKKKKQAEIEENPDLEDPRLYSPLQEPDRPAPQERSQGDENKSTSETNESPSSNDEGRSASSEGN
jgi:hypothetical protein